MTLRPLALLPLLAAAGCVSSGGSDTLRAIPSDIAANGHVSVVELNTAPPNGSPKFKDVFVGKVTEKLKGCATGTRPLRLVIDITEFKRANAAAAVLVGSSNVIRGTARFHDPETAAIVADYEVNRSVGGGGWIAAAAMAQAEEQMGSAFGDELCKKVFIRR